MFFKSFLLKSKYIWKSFTLPKCFPNFSHSFAIFTILLYSYTTFYKIFLFYYIYAKSLSRVWLFAPPWTVAHEAPLTMGFPRQIYWSGLPFPSPGDLPDPGIEPMSLTFPAFSGRFFTTSTTWEAPFNTYKGRYKYYNTFILNSIHKCKSLLCSIFLMFMEINS